MPQPHYRIDLNAVLKPFVNLPQEPLAVTWKSPLRLRQEVERFAIYFRREFSYDFQQFEAAEKPKPNEKPYAAYLFINETNHYPRVWVGAFCFRWREYKDVGPRWAAQWAWLHPYYRGKGILSSTWDKFHELHGDFICEGPFSPAMEAFLRKRGKCVLCWQPLDKAATSLGSGLEGFAGLTCTHCDERYKIKTKDRNKK
jgi:hypothetical protein